MGELLGIVRTPNGKSTDDVRHDFIKQLLLLYNERPR